MDRTMKDVYTKKREHNNTTEQLTPKEAHALIANIESEEHQQQEAHEKVLTMYAADLDSYDEQIVKGMSTRRQAAEIKKLIISRRNALHETQLLSDDEHQRERYNHEIKRASFLIEKINSVAEFLPAKEEPELQPVEPSAKKQFKAIANQLKPYMKGATDEIIAHIHIYKRLPEGAKRPKWICNNLAEASRFMYWCGMKEAAIKDCIAGIDKLHAGNRPDQPELNGSIYDILKNYPKE